MTDSFDGESPQLIAAVSRYLITASASPLRMYSRRPTRSSNRNQSRSTARGLSMSSGRRGHANDVPEPAGVRGRPRPREIRSPFILWIVIVIESGHRLRALGLGVAAPHLAGNRENHRDAPLR